MSPPLRKLLSQTLTRYLGASVVALGADLASYLLLLRAGLAPVPASALAYGLGLVVHWLMSARMVFADRIAAHAAGRLRQKLLFALSALAGLAVTTGAVGALSALGIAPSLAKLVAVGLSFAATWFLRVHLVFQSPLAEGALRP